MNKSAFHQLSYGVYVVSTWDKGRATGCTANSAMQITSEPATIAVSINHDNYQPVHPGHREVRHLHPGREFQARHHRHLRLQERQGQQ